LAHVARDPGRFIDRILADGTWPEVTAAGLVVGVLFELFGVGGSNFAAPA
jgi:hypothetical protein